MILICIITLLNCASLAADFSYKGSVEEYTCPSTGYYKLEVWGAQGGAANYEYQSGKHRYYGGGFGGYTVGEIFLNAGTKLYVCVGGRRS